MADFRKCLLAFAVLALLSSLAVPVSAQQALPLSCGFGGNGAAAGPPLVRAEGLTELVGDILLTCNNGIATPAGVPVPTTNITVFLSTNITSRILDTNNFTEVLLLVDEPHSVQNPTVTLSPCDPTNTSLGICQILGTGTGAGTYNGSAGRPNVFQARLTGVNQVTFFGVPIDPPGSSGSRTFRITNLRGNANQLGVSSTLIPTQLTVNLSISSPGLLPLNNPQQTVAYIQRGLVTSVQSAQTFIQCVSQNKDLAGDATKSGTSQFSIRFDEGFPSAWKEKNLQTHMSNAPLVSGTTTGVYPSDAAQDIPGGNYNTESGFLANGVVASGTLPAGFGTYVPPNSSFTGASRGLPLAGTANAGTRLFINFGAIPNGSQIFVPTRVNLTIPAIGTCPTATPTCNVSGFAVLVGTDSTGAGGTPGSVTGNSSGIAPVTVTPGTGTTGGTGLAVYEVLYDDPSNIERISVPITVAFVANAGNNLPQPSLQSTITSGFAPLSNVGTASSTAPIPRFAPAQTPLNSFIINKCSCNILFPFVTNQQGFDTGVAIANTSVDPFGTTPQAGLVTLNYYSGGTPPPAQTTNAVVPGGQSVLFTLSGGGNFGIAATPGFQGYIIAQAQFQYCHAFAYISAQGALPTAPGASEGYLGIVLDTPFTSSRTGQSGEVAAN